MKNIIIWILALVLAFPPIGSPNVAYARDITNYTKLNWVKISDLSFVTVNSTGEMGTLVGDYILTTNNKSAAILKREDTAITASQIDDALYTFGSNAPVLLARYNPTTAQMILFAIKLQRDAKGTVSAYYAIVTPEYFDIFKAVRAYRTQNEYIAGMDGINPFDRFKGGNQMFNDIGIDGSTVALGMAMRQLNATIGFLANIDMRIAVRKKKSGNALRKKITYYIEGFWKPHWWVAAPPSVLPTGNTSLICATDEDPCPAEHIATSGIALEEWNSGNMPTNELKTLLDKKTQSGFTILAMALVAGLGGIVAFGFGFTSTLFGTIQTTSMASAFAVNAGLNLAASMLTGASPTDIATGSGWIPMGLSWSTSKGDSSAQIPTDKYGRQFANFMTPKQLATTPGSGTEQIADFYTSRLNPNPGSYTEFNTLQAMKAGSIPDRTLFEGFSWAVPSNP